MAQLDNFCYCSSALYIDICTAMVLYLLLLLFAMYEIEWWNNAMCLPYPTLHVDKMTDKTKRQKKKRLEDKKRERQKQIRWWNNAKCSPHSTSGGQDDRENLLYASNTMRREEFYSHESEIYFQKLKMHVEKCSCPKVNVGWNLHVQMCFIMSFRWIWIVVWMESFLEFWYFDVPHIFIQKKLWL